MDTIGSKQITFVHTSQLNDPFDPYLYLETEFENQIDLLAYVRNQHEDDFGWFLQDIEHCFDGLNKVREIFNAYRNSMYVFSTSAVYESAHPRDNLYMWGHYANGHRGIGIEFDPQELTSELSNEIDIGDDTIDITTRPWTKINYMDRFPRITCEMIFEFLKGARRDGGEKKSSLHDYVEDLAKAKSKVWKDENEWRLMWRNDETRSKIIRKTINSDAIKDVYIGMRASNEVQSDVKFELRRKFPHASLWKARKRPGEFALDFEAII
jgi:hypothetical protein